MTVGLVSFGLWSYDDRAGLHYWRHRAALIQTSTWIGMCFSHVSPSYTTASDLSRILGVGGLQFGGSKRSAPPVTTSNATADVPGVKAVDRAKSLSALLPDLGSGDPKDDSPNVTVAVAVPATFFREALSSPVFWHGNARGYMLGFSGKRAKEQLLLTMILWPRINDTTAACTGKHCHVDTDTCIILQGPSHLMPKTKRPPRCFLEAVPPSVSRQVFLQRSAADTGGRVNCSGGIWTSFLYKPNPDLTVMLSYGDRSLVNLHLIHTSYFLFFVVMTLACYAIIRGRFHKVTLEKQKVLHF
ncbi:hypothetical protein MTO96_002726 [Rhipicephalus appendiculatus]